MLWTVLEHFGPVFLMGALILASQSLTRRVHSERLRVEARRLRTSLAINLQALRDLYTGDLRVFAGGKHTLMSGRQQINLLRTQLGRLLLLEQPEIEAVMSACIATERAESAMAVAGKSVAGVSFSIPSGEEDRRTLESALRQACSMLEVAESHLTPGQKGQDEGSAETRARLELRGVDNIVRAKPHEMLESAPRSATH